MTGFNTDGIHLRKNGGIVPTPPTDKVILYVDASGLLQSKDETGTITAVGIDLTNEVAVVSGGVDTNTASIAVNVSDLSDLSLDVAVVSGGVDTNTTNIGINQTDIQTNKNDITDLTSDVVVVSGGVDANASSIGTNTTNIGTNTTNVGTNTTNIGTNTTDIGTNTSDISDLTADVAVLSGGIDANTSDIAAIQGDYVDLSSGQSVGGAKTFSDDVTINSNLYVNGTEFIVDTTSVSATDNTITINAGEVGAGVTAGVAGIIVDRGTETNYQIVFNETSDTFRVGEIGSEQAVATREDSPIDGGVAVWDNSTLKFNTSTDFVDKSTNQTVSGDKTFTGTTSFTDVGSSIIPDTSGAYDLGTEALPFKDLYLNEGSLHLGPNKLSTNVGSLLFNDAGLDAGQLITTATVRSDASITAGKGVSIDATSSGEAVEGIDSVATRFTPTANNSRSHVYRLEYVEEDKVMVFDSDNNSSEPIPYILHYPGGTLTKVEMDTWVDGALASAYQAFDFKMNEAKTQVAVTYKRQVSFSLRIFVRVGTFDNGSNVITWGSEIEVADTGDLSQTVGGITMDIIPDTNYGVIGFGKESGGDCYCGAIVFDFADGSTGTEVTALIESPHAEPGRGCMVASLSSSRIFITGTAAAAEGGLFLLSRSGMNLSVIDSDVDYNYGNPAWTSNGNRPSVLAFGGTHVVIFGTEAITGGNMSYIVIDVSGDNILPDPAGWELFLETNSSTHTNFKPFKKFGDRDSNYFSVGCAIVDGTDTGYMAEGVFDGSAQTATLTTLIPFADPNTTVNQGALAAIEVAEDKWVTLWDNGVSSARYSDINLTSQTTYIGLASADAAAGEIVKVITKGSYATTGLTETADQYLDLLGNVTEIASQYPLGMASNATTLIVDFIANLPVSDAAGDLAIHEADTSIHWPMTDLDGSLTNSIIPDTSGAYDLGTEALPFKDLYLNEGSLHLGPNKLSTASGILLFNDAGINAGQLITTATVRSDASITAGKGVSIDQTSSGEAVEGIDSIATRATPIANSNSPGTRYLLEYVEEDKIMVFDLDFGASTEPIPYILHYPASVLTKVEMDTWVDGANSALVSFAFKLNEAKTQVAVTYTRFVSTTYRIYLRVGTFNNGTNVITWASEIEIGDTLDNSQTNAGLTMDMIPDTNYGVIGFGKELAGGAHCAAIVFDFADGSTGSEVTALVRTPHAQPARGCLVASLSSSRIFITGTATSSEGGLFLLSRSGMNLSVIDSIVGYAYGNPAWSESSNPTAISFSGNKIMICGTETNSGGNMSYIVIDVSGDNIVPDPAGWKLFLATDISNHRNFVPYKKFGDRDSNYFSVGCVILDGSSHGYMAEGVFDGNTKTATNTTLIPFGEPNIVVSQGSAAAIEVAEDKWVTIGDSWGSFSDINLTSQTTYIGLAAASAAAGEIVNVITKGSYITTGLTETADQYLDLLGNVTESITEFPIGMASNATTLIVDYIPNPPVSDAETDLAIHEADTSIHWEMIDLDGSLTNSIVPSTSGTLDLGSAAKPFKDLYLTNNSLYLGSDVVTSDNGTLQVNGFDVGSGGSSGSFNPATPTVYNVLDYGADNTGVLETRQKIQDAIDDINTAAEPAILYFPTGTYNISAVGAEAFSVSTAGLQIVGDGIDQTILEADLSHPSCTRFWLGTGNFNKVLDMTIDGTDTGTDMVGIWYNVAPKTLIQRVKFQNFTGHQIRYGTCNHSAIRDCEFLSSDDYSIDILSDFVEINNCNFSSPAGGIDLFSNANAIRITNNIFFVSTQPAINFIAGCSKNIVSNNYIATAGILLQIDGDENTIVGNLIDSSSATAIDINGDSNTLVGNTIDGDVLVDVASTNNYVADNVLVGGDITNSSANSVSILRASTGELLIDKKVHAPSFEVDDLQYTAGAESVTPNVNDYGMFEYTLDGAVTLNAPSNMNIGQAAMIVLTQDISGARVLTVDAAYLWEGGTEPTWTTTASSTDVISVVRTTAGYISAAMLDVS